MVNFLNNLLSDLTLGVSKKEYAYDYSTDVNKTSNITNQDYSYQFIYQSPNTVATTKKEAAISPSLGADTGGLSVPPETAGNILDKLPLVGLVAIGGFVAFKILSGRGKK